MLIKEYILRVPEEQDELITTVVEKLGAELAPINEAVTKKLKKEKRKLKKETDSDISPTYLFGAWKDLDIDPDKLRQQAWGRNQKF